MVTITVLVIKKQPDCMARMTSYKARMVVGMMSLLPGEMTENAIILVSAIDNLVHNNYI